MKRRVIIYVLTFVGLCVLGGVIQYESSFLYERPIVQVMKSEPTTEDSQKIKAVYRNTDKKGEQLQFIHYYDDGEAVQPILRKGDQVFIEKNQTWQVVEVKRDGWLFLLVVLFAYICLLIGGKRGLYSLISMGVNAVLLLGAVQLSQAIPQIPLVLIMAIFCIVAGIVALLSVDGWQKNSLLKIAATFISLFLAFFICYLAMELLDDKGLRYEEIQFLTRFYRSIFLGSLLIGTLGAVIDTVITVIATLEELVRKNPKISVKELFLSGKNVGKDVTGSMINVLLFAYLSGAIPSVLLYLVNGWSFFSAIEMHLSLEILRAICGAFGIVLSVPVSLGIYLVARRKMV
ncbi:YibE/F family protein [uncultured Enterococcus sp.]|uniref:YibE/F family protein n=1 Tax=uncultured Enterococcus sp. TaxID=167972 RepID=UPI002AA7ABC8|nr:YibE/F family protein [uncultured Enterococcus sp.]